MSSGWIVVQVKFNLCEKYRKYQMVGGEEEEEAQGCLFLINCY